MSSSPAAAESKQTRSQTESWCCGVEPQPARHRESSVSHSVCGLNVSARDWLEWGDPSANYDDCIFHAVWLIARWLDHTFICVFFFFFCNNQTNHAHTDSQRHIVLTIFFFCCVGQQSWWCWRRIGHRFCWVYSFRFFFLLTSQLDRIYAKSGRKIFALFQSLVCCWCCYHQVHSGN